MMKTIKVDCLKLTLGSSQITGALEFLIKINCSRFAQAIPGASSRSINLSQEHHPPLQASNRRSELRGIQIENKLTKIPPSVVLNIY